MNKKAKIATLAISLTAVCAISVAAVSLHAAGQPQTDSPAAFAAAQGRDLTVQLDGLSQQDLDGKAIRRMGSNACFAHFYAGPEELYARADTVVYARIEEVTYFAYHGTACTKSDVTVLDCMKGDLKQDDQISITQLGGYIPLRLEAGYATHPERFSVKEETLDQTVVFNTINSEPLPEAGQIGVFFLAAQNGPNDEVAGAYPRLASYQSVYLQNENGVLERYAETDNQYVDPDAPQTLSADSDLLQNGERPYTYEQMKELLLKQEATAT